MKICLSIKTYCIKKPQIALQSWLLAFLTTSYAVVSIEPLVPEPTLPADGTEETAAAAEFASTFAVPI